jgi:hypothetical protein
MQDHPGLFVLLSTPGPNQYPEDLSNDTPRVWGPGVGKMHNEHGGKCMDEYVEKDKCLGPDNV